MQLAWTCSQETTLTPTTCPQQATPLGTGGQAQSVQWTLWNNPFAGAAVVAKTTPGDPAKHTGPTTKITVYVAFQMSATYTETDGSGPYRSYSAGIGAATMTWDGSSFVDATFSPGSVAGHLLPGVKAPSIPRTANTGDGVVRSAVQSGLNACVAAAAAPDPVLICPQTTAVGEQWTLSGDPTLGATVAYDPTDGLFTVTGTYAMTSNLGNASSGPYTATLFFDGTQLQVLSIAAG